MTAVKWLVSELEKTGFTSNNLVAFYNDIEQAKEMEKQQIIDAELGKQLVSSLTEISDEEIEKQARILANIEHNRPLDEEERYYKNYQLYDGIVLGMKAYREQLKQRQ